MAEEITDREKTPEQAAGDAPRGVDFVPDPDVERAVKARHADNRGHIAFAQSAQQLLPGH
jgi:hypothetical protein